MRKTNQIHDSQLRDESPKEAIDVASSETQQTTVTENPCSNSDLPDDSRKMVQFDLHEWKTLVEDFKRISNTEVSNASTDPVDFQPTHDELKVLARHYVNTILKSVFEPEKYDLLEGMKRLNRFALVRSILGGPVFDDAVSDIREEWNKKVLQIRSERKEETNT